MISENSTAASSSRSAVLVFSSAATSETQPIASASVKGIKRMDNKLTAPAPSALLSSGMPFCGGTPQFRLAFPGHPQFESRWIPSDVTGKAQYLPSH